MNSRSILAIVVLGSIAIVAPNVEAAVAAANLRCEYLVNPLGIDATSPRLSWVLQSEERGQKQTAYRVLVATSRRKLDADQADLWDTGRLESDQTVHIAYAGRPLQTRMQCFWKVRAWDKDGKPSAWSEPASWSMGLLKPEDWASQWIAAGPDPAKPMATPHNGFHSRIAPSADVAKWVALDLRQPRLVDAVRLHPARPFDYADTPGFLFPVRLKIEAAEKVDFSDAKTVADQTGADVPNPGVATPIYKFPPVLARYVRMTVTRLARRDGSNHAFALAEMQVLVGDKNVAVGSAVTASDSIESGGWSQSRLVDDRLLPERGMVEPGEAPSTMLRKEFEVGGAVRRATVSVTGLGLNELHINGHKVGDHLLAPEWTRYSRRIQYQTYDVTDLVRNGKNAVGAQLGGGWWTGPLMAKPPMPLARFCLLMRLDVELADGTTQTVVTDPAWQSTTDGPIRRAGIYFGETYDATREQPGWDQPGFAAAGWRSVEALPHPDEAKTAKLVAQCNEPIRAVQELKPVKVTEPKPGVYVFDMGQNMVGWCRLKADAPKGTKITLRHAEMLKDDGTIYTDNLRGAAQVTEYTWRGGEATLEPHFTYYGFRYVELTGLPGRANEETLAGKVICSAAPDAGRFTCSHELINKIMHCVEWTQRANMYSAPTDCPQRTEREGWMGDIQAFSQTAIFNRDMAGFFTKWVPDVRDSQADDGRYPDVAPHVSDPNQTFSGVPAWGDAGTVVPWRMYENYADRRMLEQHFDSARRWVDFIHTNNANLLWQKNRGNDYNDWLNGDTLVLKDYPRGISAVPNEVFATAFFAHSTEIVAKMARVLGRAEDAAKYGKLFDDIKKAFNQAYVAPDGRVRGDTQAGYVLALHFNLLDPPQRPKAVQHLLEAIKKYKDHPSTGIQATHRMLLELSRNGCHDEAWRLADLRTVPSWGYMVDRGATTIWERWDGYVRGRGFQDPGMNSFNHWAFGSIGEWVWRELAGIQPDEEQPGFKHFTIRPRPCPGLTWAKGEYASIRGRILSDWRQEGNRFSLRVVIPPNTTATICLPAKDADSVMEGDQSAAKAPGVRKIVLEGDHALLQLDSGVYGFSSTMN